MGQEARPQPAQVVVDERALGRAVVRGLVVLQAELGDLVGQGDEEVVAAEVVRAEQRLRLGDEAGVPGDHLGRDVEGGVAVGGQVQPHRRLLRQLHGLEVRAGEDRGVHERRERHRREVEAAGAGGRLDDGQGGAVLPARGQAQRGLDDQVVGPAAVGEQHELVPHHHGEARRGAGAVGEAAGRGRGQVVELGDEGVGAGGDLEVEEVHVDGIALPGHGLAASGQAQAGEVDDRPRRRVLAGDPLGVGERQRAGPGGQGEPGVEDLAWRLAGVDLDDDGALGGAGGRGGEGEKAEGGQDRGGQAVGAHGRGE